MPSAFDDTDFNALLDIFPNIGERHAAECTGPFTPAQMLVITLFHLWLQAPLDGGP